MHYISQINSAENNFVYVIVLVLPVTWSYIQGRREHLPGSEQQVWRSTFEHGKVLQWSRHDAGQRW